MAADQDTEKRHLLPGTAPLADLNAQLHERREAALLGGGEEKVAKQHERGKLTALSELKRQLEKRDE